MLAKTLKVSMIAAGMLVVGGGIVAAQTTAPATEPAPVTGAAPATGAAPSTQQLSTADMLSRARTVLATLDASSQNVSRMLREARAKKDVVKALCLDDKLSQIDVAKRSAADRVQSLEGAAAAGNTERAQHDFAVIGALEERANALASEANQCIGEEKGYLGGSSLQVTVDPAIPQSDTSALPPPPVIAQLPQAASPTF